MQIHTSNKIVAGLLGFAMVLSLVVGLTVAPAQTDAATYTFTKNLTIGSRGADVVELQTVLETEGYLTMPAGVAKGYFGSLTKKALAAYQAANGIAPAAGYFGALTRAFVNGSSPVTPSTPGCPAGALFNSMTGAPCSTTTPTTPGTLDNTDGSITASLSSTVGSGVQIKKGEAKDMIAVDLKATAGKVAVTRFDVRFDTRPWLYFSKIQLKGTNGAVIAEKAITASDFTEITAGTDYLLRFEGLNYVVSTAQKETLTVAGTVLSVTDKLASNKSVVVSVPTGSIRTVNGKGYTDSLGDSTFTRTVTLLSTGSIGNIVGRINANSPAAKTVQTSTTGQTNGVELMKFDLKSENTNSTVNALSLKLWNSKATATTTIFKAVKLVVDGTTYNADSIASANGSTTFTSLNISLPQDQWKTVSVVADIADQDDFTAGTMASSSLALNASNVVGVDVNYNDVTTTANTVVSADLTFLNTAGAVSNTTTKVSTVSNVGYAVGVDFGFRFTNNSNSDLYISKTVRTALATSSTITGNASSTVSAVATNPSTESGDTTSFYVIPSGTYRDFTFSGSMSNYYGTAGVKTFQVDSVYYTDDTGSAQKYNISFGLENLKATYFLTAS